MKVQLASSNLPKSISYWRDLLGFTEFEKDDKSITIGINDQQAKLQLVDIREPINHATAYGRIAFACPFKDQPDLSKKVEASGNKILTPLISLETPGKANVRVIIVADPDGHEICFVDDEGFTELSKIDVESEKILDRFIKKEAAL